MLRFTNGLILETVVLYRGRPTKVKTEETTTSVPKRRSSINYEKVLLDTGQIAYRGRPAKVKTEDTTPAVPKRRSHNLEKVILSDGQIAYRGRPAKVKGGSAIDAPPGIPK